MSGVVVACDVGALSDLGEEKRDGVMIQSCAVRMRWRSERERKLKVGCSFSGHKRCERRSFTSMRRGGPSEGASIDVRVSRRTPQTQVTGGKRTSMTFQPPVSSLSSSSATRVSTAT